MIKLSQAIVVEGKYDKNALRQLVDAPVFETNGFGVMKNRELVELLRLTARRRGLIVLTDSDGAGFVIRNYLKRVLPKAGVLHAYVPDVYGKERRKAHAGKEGKLGVEGMPPKCRRGGFGRPGAARRAYRQGRPLCRGLFRPDGQRGAARGAFEGAVTAGAHEQQRTAGRAERFDDARGIFKSIRRKPWLIFR